MGRTYVEGREVEMSPTQISESGHVIMLTADRKVYGSGANNVKFIVFTIGGTIRTRIDSICVDLH